MKRTVLALGLAAVALACCGVRLLFAQQTAPAPMRVGIVNVGLIFTKYEKAKAYKVQMERMVDPFKLDAEKLKKEMLGWSEIMRNPKFDPKERERYENGIKDHQRKLEDLELQVRKLVGKTQEDQVTNLYKEVLGAIQYYAQQNRYTMVLGYGEQIDGDLYAFPNINRKMQGMDMGSCDPLYVGSNVDISQAVADSLNASYLRAAERQPAISCRCPGPLPGPIRSSVVPLRAAGRNPSPVKRNLPNGA